jgi:peptide/nickel transport system permease protein
MSEAVLPVARRRARRMPPVSLVAGVLLLLLFLLAALAPELLSPADPLKIDYLSILKPPGAAHWFGTDNLGRDILARTIHAARLDLQIALLRPSPRS